MKEKNDDLADKTNRGVYQTAEEKKREIQENRRLYCFIPKDAPSIWRRVMDVTNGKGICPYRYGKELEEYRSNVPRCLRRMKGFSPDEVAAMLGLEGDNVLYEELYWSGRKPEVDIPEHVQEYEDSLLKAKRSIPIEMEPDFLYLEEQERKREEKERELEKIWYEEVCLY